MVQRGFPSCIANQRTRQFHPDDLAIFSHISFLESVKRDLPGNKLFMQFDIESIIILMRTVLDTELEQFLFRVPQNTAELFIDINVFAIQ